MINIYYPRDTSRGEVISDIIKRLFDRLPNNIDEIDLNKIYEIKRSIPSWLPRGETEKELLNFLYKCKVVEKHKVTIKIVEQKLISDQFPWKNEKKYEEKRSLLEVEVYIKVL